MWHTLRFAVTAGLTQWVTVSGFIAKTELLAALLVPSGPVLWWKVHRYIVGKNTATH